MRPSSATIERSTYTATPGADISSRVERAEALGIERSSHVARAGALGIEKTPRVEHAVAAERPIPLTLADLRPGESAVVRRVGDSPLKRRLQELGLDSGVTVTCLFCSPLGDPVAYEFASGTVAIRRADGESVSLWD